jgi:hypothetical protein
MAAESPELVVDRAEPSAFDWSSVAGGAVIAASLAFLLITFGSAVGFSVTSPWTTTRPEVVTISLVAAGWYLLVSLMSYIAGGYVAARLRARRHDASLHEARIRDGLHGAGVWGFGVFLTVVLAFAGAAQLGSGAVRVGEAAGKAASAVAGTEAADPSAYYADVLLRREQPTPAEIPVTIRTEVQRGLARAAATGELADQDRTYLSRLVAAHTGIEPAQAEQRVTQVTAQLQRGVAETRSAAREAAEKARRGFAIAGFLTAAAFMIALGGAWIGAMLGGEHRDAGTIFRPLAPRVPREV